MEPLIMETLDGRLRRIETELRTIRARVEQLDTSVQLLSGMFLPARQKGRYIAFFYAGQISSIIGLFYVATLIVKLFKGGF